MTSSWTQHRLRLPSYVWQTAAPMMKRRLGMIFSYITSLACGRGIHPSQVDSPYRKTAMQTQIARFTGPTWGPPGADRTQGGPMLAPSTLLSGKLLCVFDVSLDKLLNKQFSCQWSEMPWHSYDIIVMLKAHITTTAESKIMDGTLEWCLSSEIRENSTQFKRNLHLTLPTCCS